MKRISSEHVTCTLCKDHLPVERTTPGEIVIFETLDCYGNQLQNEETAFTSTGIRRDFNNPATGPLYVEGAELGDTLKVEILDIQVADHGVMAVRPGAGALGDVFQSARTKIIPVRAGQAIFNEQLSLPLHPMIGVIGTAPLDEMKTTVPHLHGGNMDCKRIIKGSTLYLPVFVEGALLSIGDLHGLMGDGEIVICALEMQGSVTVKVEVIKGQRLPLPFVVEGDSVMTISSEETLDQAATSAAKAMHAFLQQEVGIDVHEAGMILSLIGELKICQIVDPLLTTRMELPLSVLQKYGYQLP
jgi:amidase